jgi:hypothetical protein
VAEALLLKSPVGQGVQEVEPAEEAKEPGAHALHCALPGEAL